MISIEGLTKRYGGFVAVDNVSFHCRPGTVTGFLGPNGAGKTTTLRILAGLTEANEGSATVAGHRYADLSSPGTEVGVLLDASAQHAGRTGREVLALGALAMGLPQRRVDDMLEQVSLTPAESRRRIRNYSLGMRQRLGIAHALLGDPRVLVLDEPANGLDPAGIHWMRRLLREYADRGGTVLLSSHLLREVEVVADELVVIGQGRIVAQGSKAELLSAAGTLVRALDTTALRRALDAAGIEYDASAGEALRTDAAPERVGQAAADSGIALVELRSADGAGLEEMFLQLTAETQREHEPEGAVA